MTKQIPDKVLYNNQEFILAGLKGHGLFKPIDFGISPEMTGIATACYRGYFCKYACMDNKLFLVELSVIQSNHERLPLIEGISAESDDFLFSRYQNLKIPCPLSGGLLIVQNPITHPGHFPNPIEFSEVVELTFEQGFLQNKIDHSTKMAELRQRVDELRKYSKPDSDLLSVISKWSSSPDKLSNQEQKKLIGYRSEVEKIHELEWSFVSNYEQQPEIQK
jgi:hypothetical protein